MMFAKANQVGPASPSFRLHGDRSHRESAYKREVEQQAIPEDAKREIYLRKMQSAAESELAVAGRSVVARELATRAAAASGERKSEANERPNLKISHTKTNGDVSLLTRKQSEAALKRRK